MELTQTYIISQIIGFTALGIAALSFQFKNQKTMFTINELSNAIWVAHYILLGGYTGAFVLTIAVIRTLTIIFIKPDWKIHILITALILNLIFCMLSPEQYWYKYLPFLSALTYSAAIYYNHNYILSRCITFFTMSIWFTYGTLILSFAEMTESVILMGSILLGFWRHKNKKSTFTTF